MLLHTPNEWKDTPFPFICPLTNSAVLSQTSLNEMETPIFFLKHFLMCCLASMNILLKNKDCFDNDLRSIICVTNPWKRAWAQTTPACQAVLWLMTCHIGYLAKYCVVCLNDSGSYLEKEGSTSKNVAKAKLQHWVGSMSYQESWRKEPKELHKESRFYQ